MISHECTEVSVYPMFKSDMRALRDRVCIKTAQEILKCFTASSVTHFIHSKGMLLKPCIPINSCLFWQNVTFFFLLSGQNVLRKHYKWFPKYLFLRLSHTVIDINQACISGSVDVVTEQQWDTGTKEVCRLFQGCDPREKGPNSVRLRCWHRPLISSQSQIK